MDQAMELGHRDDSHTCLYSCNWTESVGWAQVFPVFSHTRVKGHQVNLPRAMLNVPKEVTAGD